MFSMFCFWAVLIGAETPVDTFVFNSGAEPEVLDPHRISTNNDSLLVLQMFEGLVGRDESYDKIVPALAESWIISKDKKTYTFRLKKNLKWSNGEPLTIEDVRASFLRAMNPEVTNQFVSWYLDCIVGAQALYDQWRSTTRDQLEKALGIQIKDSQTIEIRLIKPTAQFLDYLALPSFAIVHSSMFKPYNKWKEPKNYVVNGAYKLTDWKVNQKVTLEKNPFYWDAKRVSIPKVEALAVSDHTATYNLYKTRDIDWTGSNTIASSQISSLRGDKEFQLYPCFGTYKVIFNVSKKPFDDVRVRRALGLAIHRAEITDKILRGGQVPSHRLIPFGIKGYRPTITPPEPFDLQIEKAKRLLAEAGYPNGKGFPKVTYAYNTNEGHHKIAQALQQMWKKYLGIEIELMNMEWKVFIKEQSSKAFEISRLSWIADIPDPTSMLDVFKSNSQANYSNWGSKRYDALLLQASQVMDDKKRFALLSQAEQLLLDEAPITPIYHYVWFSMLSPRVEGFTPNLMGKYQFKYLRKR